MKTLFKLSLSSLLIFICSYTFSQTTRPQKEWVCFWNEKGDSCFEWWVSSLPDEYFPWGVCNNWIWDNSTLSLSDEEFQWTKIAMHEWNKRFKEYKLNRWGRLNIEGLPKGNLFIESCDKIKHNILYLFKKPFDVLDAIAFYRPRLAPQKIFYKYFYGTIKMELHRDWKKWEFINVMMHELGHSLGLGHEPLKDTQFMSSTHFNECEYKKEICYIKNKDLDNFVSLHNKKLLKMSEQSYNNYLNELDRKRKERAEEEEKRYRRRQERLKAEKERLQEEFQSYGWSHCGIDINGRRRPAGGCKPL